MTRWTVLVLVCDVVTLLVSSAACFWIYRTNRRARREWEAHSANCQRLRDHAAEYMSHAKQLRHDAAQLKANADAVFAAAVALAEHRPAPVQTIPEWWNCLNCHRARVTTGTVCADCQRRLSGKG